MKRGTSILLCIMAMVAFALWAPDADAFKFYSQNVNATGNCAGCHAGFRETGDYFSNKDGAFWGTSLHNGHLNNTTIGSSCDNCHGGVDITAVRMVNLSSSGTAADGVNFIACSGCHQGPGLRAHHAANGVTVCAGCHSDPTPLGENVAPPWYGSVINNLTGTNLAPCNENGEENFAGSSLGLDNDGDNAYDMADSDCSPPAPELAIPVQEPALGGGTVAMPVTFTQNATNISATVFSVDYDQSNLSIDPTAVMGFPWPDAVAINPLLNPFFYTISITLNTNDPDGELDVNIYATNGTRLLPEGDLITITFDVGNPPVETEAPVIFSSDPSPSFGNSSGASVAGSLVDGSVLITPNCIPTAEICDGLDNDCDGSIDENLTRTTTCGQGACSGNTGTETCTAGTWGGDTCDPLAGATAEVCDAVDNDCDGATDENLTRPTTCGVGECSGNTGTETCSVGTWGNDTCDPLAGATTEVCDNLDNDCDGSTDEDLTRATTCGLGECSGNTGTETCSAGTWGGDTCDPTAGATPEVCDAGNLDEDCDGTANEGCDCIDGETRPTTCGIGECAATGQETCSGGVWGNDTCTPGTPTAEVCDGLDNDCNGTADDGIAPVQTTCGVGECAATGTETCVNGTTVDDCTAGTPTTEVCDGLDNDCNGTADDGIAPVPTTCGTGECASAGEIVCVGGAEVDTCTAGTPAAEVCDNLDNDCDGSTDEDLTRATTCGTGECGATGVETCSAGAWVGDTCTPGTPTAEVCDNLDNDCDGVIDGITRGTTCGVGQCAGNTGEETCTAGTWGNDTCDPFAGAMPEGPSTDATCSDNLDNDCDGLTDLIDPDPDCVAAVVDLDISRFRVSNSARVGEPIKRIQITVSNPNGGSTDMRPATLIGVQNGVEVYNRTRMVFDLAGTGRARFAFPSYTPTVAGTIEWTLVINDDDPDDDTAIASTSVKIK